MNLETRAARAYRAYADHTGGLNYQGNPMPTWEALPEPQRGAWLSAIASTEPPGPVPAPPTPGRIVLYRLTAGQADVINEATRNTDDPLAHEGDALPAVVVAVDEARGTVNVRTFVDAGCPDLWVHSVEQGNEPGGWSWPPRAGS